VHSLSKKSCRKVDQNSVGKSERFKQLVQLVDSI
jgi:hypothetical protein